MGWHKAHHNLLKTKHLKNMTDFSKTLIRCSALGYVMTEPRTKTAKENGELSETCKDYLIDAYIAKRYERVKEIEAKQLAKGRLVEYDSLMLLSLIDGRIYNKNTERLNNEFITGIPDTSDAEDIRDAGEVIDIKSCWDLFSFLQNVTSPENKMHYWQLQGYMALTGAQIGTIAFCLVNTPDSIVEGEKYALLKRMDVATEEHPDYQEQVSQLIKNRKFDDIPMEERILLYSIDRNDEDIERAYDKVLKCRDFLTEVEEKHLKFSNKFRKRLFFMNRNR